MPLVSGVDLDWSLEGDTMTIIIVNNSGGLLENIYISDHTSTPANLLSCQVDNQTFVPVETSHPLSSVYPGQYTTQWSLGSCLDRVVVRYYPWSDRISFNAFGSSPIFGVMKNIGPPMNVTWLP